MKLIRLLVATFVMAGLSITALPASAQQQLNTKQQAAQVAVQLGYLTYQGHVIKEMRTANDTEIEQALEEAMTEYADKMNKMTLEDLSAGKMPAFNPAHAKRMTKAFLAAQTLFSESEVDMNAAQETTSALMQQLILAAAMSGLYQQ